MLEKNNFKQIDPKSAQMFINQIFKDYSLTRATQSKFYPKPVERFEIERLPTGQIMDFWAEKIKKILAYEKNGVPDDNIPVCTPKERWEKPPIYKVYKAKFINGKLVAGDRALKKFESKDQAELHIKALAKSKALKSLKGKSFVDMDMAIKNASKNFESDYIVKEVRSIPLKCKYFCDVKQWCNYYKELEQDDSIDKD